MLYYDLRLGAIALLLTLVRAAVIMGTSALRITTRTGISTCRARSAAWCCS